MFFIGQDHIKNQLDISLNHLYNNKEGAAFLLRGPSGYGKTELAMRICNYLVMSKYCMYLGDLFSRENFREDVWVHFIDEIHLLKEPEILYPIIDSNKYVFVLATNHDSFLQEALSNRCTNLLFANYTDDELISIFSSHFRMMELPIEVIKYIIEISARNPRIMIKTYGKNLYMYYLNNRNELKKPIEEIIKKIDEIHGIKNGLDRICNLYLETLQNLGGKASIDLLSAAIKLDINTVKYSIEPVLLYKNKIKISNKGRELCP